MRDVSVALPLRSDTNPHTRAQTLYNRQPQGQTFLHWSAMGPAPRAPADPLCPCVHSAPHVCRFIPRLLLSGPSGEGGSEAKKKFASLNSASNFRPL